MAESQEKNKNSVVEYDHKMDLKYVGLKTQLYTPAYRAGRELCSLYVNTTQNNLTQHSAQSNYIN